MARSQVKHSKDWHLKKKKTFVDNEEEVSAHIVLFDNHLVGSSSTISLFNVHPSLFSLLSFRF